MQMKSQAELSRGASAASREPQPAEASASKDRTGGHGDYRIVFADGRVAEVTNAHSPEHAVMLAREALGIERKTIANPHRMAIDPERHQRAIAAASAA